MVWVRKLRPRQATAQCACNLQPLGLLGVSCCLPRYPCLPLSGPARPRTHGTHLKEALPLAQAAALQAPEVDVGFPTGDEQSGVCGVEGGYQHGLVGALWGMGDLNEVLKATRATTPTHVGLPSTAVRAVHSHPTCLYLLSRQT